MRTGPAVTVVVATYGRPEALAVALTSALSQTMSDLTVLVVGDCCPPGTADAVVADLDDDRLVYVNLPSRQGEQGPPNSVGTALATTPYVAYLNQDDLWLTDHLARAVADLAEGTTDFFAGSTAFAPDVRSTDDGARPVFAWRTPDERELADCFWSSGYVFEPATSWVLRREAALSVGPWAPATTVHRSPLHDWVLRAWRAGLTFRHDTEVTSLKVNTHHVGRSGLEYDHGPDDVRELWELVSGLGDAGVRTLVAEDLRRAKDRGFEERHPELPFGGHAEGLAYAQRLRRAADRFLLTGKDEFDDISVELGMVRGHVLRDALQRRTGETLGPAQAMDDLVADARRQLLAQ